MNLESIILSALTEHKTIKIDTIAKIVYLNYFLVHDVSDFTVHYSFNVPPSVTSQSFYNALHELSNKGFITKDLYEVTFNKYDNYDLPDLVYPKDENMLQACVLQLNEVLVHGDGAIRISERIDWLRENGFINNDSFISYNLILKHFLTLSDNLVFHGHEYAKLVHDDGCLEYRDCPLRCECKKPLNINTALLWQIYSYFCDIDSFIIRINTSPHKNTDSELFKRELDKLLNECYKLNSHIIKINNAYFLHKDKYKKEYNLTKLSIDKLNVFTEYVKYLYQNIL